MLFRFWYCSINRYPFRLHHSSVPRTHRITTLITANLNTRPFAPAPRNADCPCSLAERLMMVTSNFSQRTYSDCLQPRINHTQKIQQALLGPALRSLALHLINNNSVSKDLIIQNRVHQARHLSALTSLHCDRQSPPICRYLHFSPKVSMSITHLASQMQWILARLSQLMSLPNYCVFSAFWSILVGCQKLNQRVVRGEQVRVHV